MCGIVGYVGEKQCNKILENAEKKITILLENNGNLEEKSFETNNE